MTTNPNQCCEKCDVSSVLGATDGCANPPCSCHAYVSQKSGWEAEFDSAFDMDGYDSVSNVFQRNFKEFIRSLLATERRAARREALKEALEATSREEDDSDASLDDIRALLSAKLDELE